MKRRNRLHSCVLGSTRPCPVCRAEAVEALLKRGRSDMALVLARDLATDMIEWCGQHEWQAAQDALASWHAAWRREAGIAGKQPQARLLSWHQGFNAGMAAAPAAWRQAVPSRSVADPVRLAWVCATPEGRALACVALKIGGRDLDPILAGRVGLAPSAWKRLWVALGDAEIHNGDDGP